MLQNLNVYNLMGDNKIMLGNGSSANLKFKSLECAGAGNGCKFDFESPLGKQFTIPMSEKSALRIDFSKSLSCDDKVAILTQIYKDASDKIDGVAVNVEEQQNLGNILRVVHYEIALIKKAEQPTMIVSETETMAECSRNKKHPCNYMLKAEFCIDKPHIP